MSLTRAFTKAVNKATYDPELEKQLAAERAKAREIRTKFRQTLSESTKKNRQMLANGQITKQGSTLANALIKETLDWLKNTPDATDVELQDKTFEFLDKLTNIYDEDKNRLQFSNWINFFEFIIPRLQNENRIPEESAKKLTAIVNENKTWFKNHQNESIETYQGRIEEESKKIQEIFNDPEILEQQKLLEKANNDPKELERLKAQALAEKKAKEDLEKSRFSLPRITKKISRGLGIAITVAVFFALGLTGASLLANEAIARPVPYRILYFIFGFIFSIPVILFYIGRTFMGQPPYYAAYLLPLYSYDPLKEEHTSFFERLVWFKENAVVRDATERFMDKANAVKALQLARG
jgi:hypothetical protein